jgi:predicted Zn-dependent protease
MKAKRRTRTLAIAIALVGIALASSGCLTRAGEQTLGDQAAEQVKQTMGLAAESAVTRYVRAVCERLAANSERPEGPWSFQVADTPDPNAFAIPGGHVYITRGLLTLLNSEDELAGVMGHELGHVTGRHTAKRFSAAVATSPITIVTGIAGFATGLVSRQLGDAVSGSGQALSRGLVLAPYSRSQESDADRIGQKLSATTGYDPAGLTHFLHTLDREVERLSGEPAKFSFFADHPMTPDRVKATTERAKTLEWTPGQPIASHAELLVLLDGLVVGPDPAQGVFENNLFLHPGLDLAVQFPADWKAMNSASAAGALSPRGDAAIMLQVAASNTTIGEAVRRIREEDSKLELEELEIGGLPAVRTRLAQRGRRAVVTWIEYRGDLFSLVGTTGGTDDYDRTFDTATRSFRPVTKAELAAIQVVRLRLRTAQPDETPDALAARTASTWDGAEIAVANGVEQAAAFAAGTTVKVALKEPWRENGSGE